MSGRTAPRQEKTSPTRAFRLAELAEHVGGRVEGDPETVITAIRTLEHAGPGELSFVRRAGFEEQARASRAAALLVPPGMDDLPHALLVAEDPSLALARLLAVVYPEEADAPPGIHATAVIGADCEIDPGAAVGPYAVIGVGSRIGDACRIGAHAVIGRHCRLGQGVVLHPHVVLYDRVELGDRVVLHSGVVLGADGFGYVFHQGEHVKNPQVGRVVVESDVELGRGCLLCGQAGLAGSAVLRDYVVMGGQAGSVGHIEIGQGAQIAARSVVTKSVPAGQKVAGNPAVEIHKAHRQSILIGKLDEMRRRLRTLEQRLDKADAESQRADAESKT